MKSYSVTIQMKATEQYFPVVLFFFQLYGTKLNLSCFFSRHYLEPKLKINNTAHIQNNLNANQT